MTYSPEQAALLAAFATGFGTIVSAFFTLLYNLYKARNEQALKKDEAADKNRDSTITSFRNEVGFNKGLVDLVFNRDEQLVAQNGKIVKLEMAVQALTAAVEMLTNENKALKQEHQALKDDHSALTQRYVLSLQRIATLETDLQETQRQLGVERKLREALEQERSPKPIEVTIMQQAPTTTVVSPAETPKS